MIWDLVLKVVNVVTVVLLGGFVGWVVLEGIARRLRRRQKPEQVTGPSAEDLAAVAATLRTRTKVVLDKEELEAFESKLETAERKNREYFALIESVLAQRDQRWKMFLDQSAGHLAAQGLYEKTIQRERMILYKAVTELNKMRKEAGLPEVEKAHELVPLDASPLGTAKRFAEMVEQMKAEVSADIDGIKKRDEIAAS